MLDEYRMLIILKDPIFVSKLIKVKNNHELFLLLLNYGVRANKNEISKLKEIVYVTKKSLTKKNKLTDQQLENISAGRVTPFKYITRPLYYSGYIPGYTLGKIPIVGHTIYHSVKDAIKGFYESLHNY